MSGPSSSEKCEPNLTPLLDLVLQLVMFFMLCANFVMEQVNETIKLPEAISAKSLDRNVEGYIILNVNPQGNVLIAKDDPLTSPVQVTNYMKQQNDADKLRTKPADWEKGKGRSLVILRADGRCNFKMVNDVMLACRRAGYSDIQLRAIQASAP